MKSKAPADLRSMSFRDILKGVVSEEISSMRIIHLYHMNGYWDLYQAFEDNLDPDEPSPVFTVKSKEGECVDGSGAETDWAETTRKTLDFDR